MGAVCYQIGVVILFLEAVGVDPAGAENVDGLRSRGEASPSSVNPRDQMDESFPPIFREKVRKVSNPLNLLESLWIKNYFSLKYPSQLDADLFLAKVIGVDEHPLYPNSEIIPYYLLNDVNALFLARESENGITIGVVQNQLVNLQFWIPIICEEAFI